MSKFIAKKVILAPIEDVFKAFMKVNKREFPKLSDKNPLGSKCSKIIRVTGNKTFNMTMEVTDYEFESIYQVTGKLIDDIYISTYKFVVEGEDRTRIELIEEQHMKSFSSKLGMIFSSFGGSKKAKKKLDYIADGVEDEIEFMKRKIDKNKKKIDKTKQ